MRPTHPVELICCAIATQEGWFASDPNVTPRALNNPGDLRFYAQAGAAPSDPNVKYSIARFASKQLGITGLFRQVWLQVASGQTLRKIIYQWAPPNENNTSIYLQNVILWTKLDPDVPVLQLLPDLTDLRHS